MQMRVCIPKQLIIELVWLKSLKDRRSDLTHFYKKVFAEIWLQLMEFSFVFLTEK